MLLKERKKILDFFQCEENREIEEEFARELSENEEAKLFFINENRAFTDGKNIVVDPAIYDFYCDEMMLKKAEKWMNIPNVFSTNAKNAIKVITRMQTIHESLHLIYSDYSDLILKDSRSSNVMRVKVLAFINNIIEDAFIETVGYSQHEDLEFFLTFGNALFFFHGEMSRDESQIRKLSIIEQYFNYMISLILYPLKIRRPNREIKRYVRKTKKFYQKAKYCGDPSERYRYAQKIFDIIEPIIPNEPNDIDEPCFDFNLRGTNAFETSEMSLTSNKKMGKKIDNISPAAVKKKKMGKKGFKEKVEIFLKEVQEGNKQVQGTDDEIRELMGEDLKTTFLHKDVKIHEKRPKVNQRFRVAYQDTCAKYRLTINSYNSKFSQLLKAEVIERDHGHLFGSGISSKRMFDHKKRVWYKNRIEVGVPEISVVLLVDGSGSMYGERRNSAVVSSVIFHEVLKRQGIEHAIVEHRASDVDKAIDVNILVDFNGQDKQKYNLMSIGASEQNRDGLAISWCANYIAKKAMSQKKVIIVLSDGIPIHSIDEYFPPMSNRDTSKIVAQTIRKGIKLIAVALDNDNEYVSSYDDLKTIYPRIIACTDLQKLTGQLLKIISKEIVN